MEAFAAGRWTKGSRARERFGWRSGDASVMMG